MSIKIKNRDPRTYDFAKDEIIINHKEGTLFFKSDNGLHKIIPGSGTSDNLGNHTATQNLDLGNNNIDNASTGSIGHIIATNIIANNTDNGANIFVKDADGNNIAVFGRIGQDANAHIGKMLLRDNADVKVVIQGKGDSYINGTSARLAIAKSSPTETLDVNGTVKATAFSGGGANITGVISASYAVSASHAVSASYAVSSSHEIVTEISSSHAVSSSYAITASHALNSGGSSISASYATTASHAQKANDFLVNDHISASKASGSNNVGDFHHFGGNVKIGTEGVQGQFYGRETGSGVAFYLPGKGTALDVCGGVRVSGSLIPYGYASHDIGSSMTPWKSLHVFNNSIHFYSDQAEPDDQSESVEDSDIRRKLLGKLQFEDGKGIVIKDRTNSITNLSGSNVIATEGMKAPQFTATTVMSAPTGSFTIIRNTTTASIGRINSVTINGGSF